MLFRKIGYDCSDHCLAYLEAKDKLSLTLTNKFTHQQLIESAERAMTEFDRHTNHRLPSIQSLKQIHYTIPNTRPDLLYYKLCKTIGQIYQQRFSQVTVAPATHMAEIPPEEVLFLDCQLERSVALKVYCALTPDEQKIALEIYEKGCIDDLEKHSALTSVQRAITSTSSNQMYRQQVLCLDRPSLLSFTGPGRIHFGEPGVLTALCLYEASHIFQKLLDIEGNKGRIPDHILKDSRLQTELTCPDIYQGTVFESIRQQFRSRYWQRLAIQTVIHLVGNAIFEKIRPIHCSLSVGGGIALLLSPFAIYTGMQYLRRQCSAAFQDPRITSMIIDILDYMQREMIEGCLCLACGFPVRVGVIRPEQLLNAYSALIGVMHFPHLQTANTLFWEKVWPLALSDNLCLSGDFKDALCELLNELTGNEKIVPCDGINLAIQTTKNLLQVISKVKENSSTHTYLHQISYLLSRSVLTNLAHTTLSLSTHPVATFLYRNRYRIETGIFICLHNRSYLKIYDIWKDFQIEGLVNRYGLAFDEVQQLGWYGLMGAIYENIFIDI